MNSRIENRKNPEIELGASICRRIKQVLYQNEPWQMIYQKVAIDFSLLKAYARKFYADKTQIEILRELRTYSRDGLADAIKCSKD